MAVAGLLLTIGLAGVVALVLNNQVRRVTDTALQYDIELEDEGDDLRVAILDVRHYHRNLLFGGPTEDAIAEFDDAYAALLEEIGELEELGIRDPDVPPPAQIRDLSQRYYADFRAAVALAGTDPSAFARASALGLSRLAELDDAATEIDRLGEERANEAFESVDQASTTAGWLLMVSLGGLLAVGAALAYAAVRVIGELDQLNADQRASAAALAHASQAKTDFIADVSHELRTPLTVLRGNAEVGLALESDCIHKPMLEEVLDESARMALMLEDLLLLARSDSASLPLKPETVAVVPFLAELAARAEMLARQRGISLNMDLSGDGSVSIDQARIEQAVLNLVDNAGKYSQSSEPVTLRATTEAGELRLEVADRGAGIPKEDLPHIFDRFYRVDKVRSRKLGGAGLGLSIVKTIVESHGGRVGAVSRLGEGTRIWLCLPLHAAEEPVGALAVSATRAAGQ